MLLKMSDIKVIVDILMGTETPDEEFELNELSLSAACEVMNPPPGKARRLHHPKVPAPQQVQELAPAQPPQRSAAGSCSANGDANDVA